MAGNVPQPLEQAYEIAKLHAAVDGAFDERLLEHWFDAAWDACAAMVGITYPEERIQEPVSVAADGSLTLSHEPTSNVRFIAGGRLIAELPPNSPCFLPRTDLDDELGTCRMCCPSLCCHCNLVASYTTGLSACEEIPSWFVQAVARLFTYIAENRGDTEMNEAVIAKCGAKAFLAPYLVYVA